MQFLHLRNKHHRKLFIRIILLSIDLQILKLSVIASLWRLKTLVLPVEVSIAASTCLALVRILESFCVNTIHDSIHLKHCLKFTDCLSLGCYPLVLKVLSLCGCWICPVVAGCDVVLARRDVVLARRDFKVKFEKSSHDQYKWQISLIKFTFW